MKKLLIKLTALGLLAVTLLALASCSIFTAKPDLDEYKKNLEDAKYLVNEQDEPELPMKEALYANKIEGGKSLTVMVFEDSKSAKLYFENMELELDNEIESIKIEIDFYEHILKKYDDKLSSDEIDEYEDEIKDLEKQLEELKDEYVLKRKGDTVWFGDKDAFEDAKG